MTGTGRPILTVSAPLGGTTADMSAVDDPVFAAGLVGPGIAVRPDAVAGRDVVAPIAGTVVKLYPHAFVVRADDRRAVLVHLGIDTVQLRGEGFTLHAREGDAVARGALVVSWDPAWVEAGGRCAVCPVVALGAASDAVAPLARTGTVVAAGADLLRWD